MFSPRLDRGSRSALLLILNLVFAFAAQGGSPDTRWMWMDGPTAGNQPGTYGSQGTPHVANNPGSRQGAATWKDGQGNLWLFGGFGYDKNGGQGFLADLWKYDIAASEWTWVKGSDVINTYGIYGSVGATSDVFRPGARYRSVCWTDAQGRFWLFGGTGYTASGASAGLADLWMYDPNPGSIYSGRWTWRYGSNARNDEGDFDSYGTPFRPPNLTGAVGWADASGNLWLFGGLFYPDAGSPIPTKRNDLWKFDIENRRWTWMKGTGIQNAPGDYGSQGNGTNSTRPGGRFVAHSWVDPQGRFWLFGGYGYGASTEGWLSDLWRYDPAGNIWTWMKGPSAVNLHATHGGMTIPASDNNPGGMTEGAAWTDARGDLWLFGGVGLAASGDSGGLSALWRYQINGNQWTWMNGDHQTGEAAVFGTPGTPDPLNANTPGGVRAAAAWVATPNRLWLFGGDYVPSAGSAFSSAFWQLAELNGISVAGPGGAPLSGNGQFGFGLTFIGTPIERTFTILNSGLAPLSGLNVAVTPIFGGGIFTLVTPPAATLAPGGSTTFTVSFTPTHASIAYATITVDDDSQDLDPFVINAAGTGTPPVVSMGVSPEWAWEDAGTPFVFTFTRTGSTANPVTVNFTVSGEATFGVDYTVAGADTFTASAGSVIIPAGSASASVQITPISETVAEDEEIVRLNIEGFSVAYAAGWPNLGEGVIASEELVIGGRDRSFYPEIIGNQIFALAAQPDGKILIGGGFESVNGQPRTNLARLHPDGTLDTSFAAPTMSVPYGVQGIIVQGDGKILVAGGPFGVSRFLANGDPDPGFTTLGNFVALSALAQQADGKILIGGFFTSIHGVPRKNIARLNPDGTLDASFDPGTGPDAWVDCIALDPNGRILVGGQFATFNGEASPGIVRLKPIDGSVDTSFDPRGGAEGGSPMYVSGIAVQRDGRILVVGDFWTFGGEPRARIVRLLHDGLLDPEFSATAGTDYAIESLALQADGKIILGGYFTQLNGQTVPNLGRLNADGTLDPTFQPGSIVSATIYSLLLLPDGRLLTGGQPSVVDEAHSAIARRANNPATQTLRPFSRTIAEWLRGGAGPELVRVTFDLSTDGGVNWTPLGSGAPFENGWRLGLLDLPISGHLRARGHTGNTYRNASSSLIEQIAPFTRAPEIVVEGPAAFLVPHGETPGPFGNPSLIDGTSEIDFGPGQSPSSLIAFGGNSMFIVHNVGNDDFPGLAVSIAGDHPGDFSYAIGHSFPYTAAIPAGGWKTVSVAFSPTVLGERRATLHFTTTDADEASFDIALTGFGASRREVWRHTHFGTLEGTGPAADTADPDGDGSDNTLEYLAALNPNDPASRFALRLEAVEGEPTQRKLLFTAQPLFPFGGNVVTYTIEYRTSLTEGEWLPLETGGIINIGFPESWCIDYDASTPAKFYRVKLTDP